MRNILGHRKLVVLFLVAILTYDNPLFSQEFEYKLKAEFIERFTRFIDWPPTSNVHDVEIPFDICIIGKNPFGEYLNSLSRKVKIKTKPVRVLSVVKEDDLEVCNVLFVANTEASQLPEILAKTSQQPILTVGDTPGFAQKGILINFYQAGNYIRFEVNNTAVHRSGLRFSSRLLKLARLVDTDGLQQGSTR